MTYTVPRLALTTSVAPDVTTLTVTGEVDLATAAQLRDEALEVLKDSPPVLELDLFGVEFMDSIGLHVLLATRRRAGLAGVQVRLVRPSRAVSRLLEVTGLTTAFECLPAGTAGPEENFTEASLTG